LVRFRIAVLTSDGTTSIDPNCSIVSNNESMN
jgi:hypothetical protein